MLNSREQRMLEIASAITHGDPSVPVDLTCPNCGYPTMVFSYTHRRISGGYGFFLLCPNCNLMNHYSFVERPPNFKEELVFEAFQKREDEVQRKVMSDEMNC
jgi:hypothetical protein